MQKSVPLILDDQGDYKYYYILDNCRQLDWSVTQPPVGDLESPPVPVTPFIFFLFHHYYILHTGE